MARQRGKSKESGSGSPSWLITFSDMMTLLLTFFVLLLSMAALRDEQKKHLALGSIAETFGMGQHTMNILGMQQSRKILDPGPFEDVKDLAPIKNILWEDKRKDIQFISNRFIQIISIQASLLFKAGETELSNEGRALLKKLAPELRSMQFPVLLAGHSAFLESGPAFGSGDSGFESPDPSWRLSLTRVLNVYSFLSDQGVRSEKLKLEAFGRYHPRYSNADSKGRQKNRRVDIILDKRNFMAHSPNKLKKFPGLPAEQDSSYDYKGFSFDLEVDQESGP